MRLVVVGSGYVGLVSGACLAELGHAVTCVDKDTAKIDRLRAGVSPIYEPGLDSLIANNAAAGRLSFETEIPPLSSGAVEAIFIAVGTPPLPNEQAADLRSVYAVVEAVAQRAADRLVVVTKSTVPVGTGDTIERILAGASERAKFSVVSNPEFLREGDAIGDFMRPDRVVIGCEDEYGRRVLSQIYAPLAARGVNIVVTRRRAAELIKYAANAFLATKISFINEIADLCEVVDADVAEVAAGIGSDSRIGPAFLKAGPGYGGSCFPKDCAALLATAQDHSVDLRLVESAITANQLRKRRMARKVIEALEGQVEGAVVAVLGLTFKANTDDMRDAPSIAIIENLRQAGATIRAYDPQGMVQARPLLGEVAYCDSAEACCEGADCIVLITEWDEFRRLDFPRLARRTRRPLFVDLRNLVDAEALSRAGFTVHAIGRSAGQTATAVVARAVRTGREASAA